jgi:hypothetical protein
MPNNELMKETTEGKSEDLRREHKQYLVAKSWPLVVKIVLRCDDIRAISSTARDEDVGHDGDADVLLDIEEAWIKRPDTTE